MLSLPGNKSGTAMVDAAILMPLVLLSVMAMIYLLINIYSSVSLQSHMHILLREESGVKSNMVKYEIIDAYKRDRIRAQAESCNIEVTEKSHLLDKYVEANMNVYYTTNSLMNRKPKVNTYGRSYIFRESDIVRFRDIVSSY